MQIVANAIQALDDNHSQPMPCKTHLALTTETACVALLTRLAAGITIGITGCYLPGIYYGFYCEEVRQSYAHCVCTCVRVHVCMCV